MCADSLGSAAGTGSDCEEGFDRDEDDERDTGSYNYRKHTQKPRNSTGHGSSKKGQDDRW